ncbi:ABC transporter permease, partial [Burkholderia cepacia]
MSTIDPVLPPPPPVRAEYTRPLDPLPDAERAAPAPLSRRIAGATWFRRGVIALVLIAVWEIVARIVANDLLVPTFGAT